MNLRLEHPFLWVILICNALIIGRIIANTNAPLETKLLLIIFGIAWACLISLSQNYLADLDNMREKEMNV